MEWQVEGGQRSKTKRCKMLEKRTAHQGARKKSSLQAQGSQTLDCNKHRLLLRAAEHVACMRPITLEMPLLTATAAVGTACCYHSNSA